MNRFCQRLHRAHDGAIGAGSLISRASPYLPCVEFEGRKHISLRPLCPHLVCTFKSCLFCSSVSPAASEARCQKHYRFLTLIAPPHATVERATASRLPLDTLCPTHGGTGSNVQRPSSQYCATCREDATSYFRSGYVSGPFTFSTRSSIMTV